MHAFFRDALAERQTEKSNRKMGNVELQDLWASCLDRFGYEFVNDKFMIELGETKRTETSVDAYFDVKSGIWSRIQMSHVGDENQIFFHQQSLNQYSAVYRLITRIRNAYMALSESQTVSKLPYTVIINTNSVQTNNLVRFCMLAFLSKMETYIHIEVVETEWSVFCETIKLKRFRSVMKGKILVSTICARLHVVVLSYCTTQLVKSYRVSAEKPDLDYDS